MVLMNWLVLSCLVLINWGLKVVIRLILFFFGMEVSIIVFFFNFCCNCFVVVLRDFLFIVFRFVIRILNLFIVWVWVNNCFDFCRVNFCLRVFNCFWLVFNFCCSWWIWFGIFFGLVFRRLLSFLIIVFCILR